MEIITSNKGKEKICLDGYMYVLHVECKAFLRWRCSKASSQKCGAILKTGLDKREPVVAKPHNHPADSEGVNVVKCVEKMKVTAKRSGANPAEIFAEAVSTLENSTKARMPIEDSAKRTLRYQRSKNNPKDPGTLSELTIEGNFLFYLYTPCTEVIKHCVHVSYSCFLLQETGVQLEILTTVVFCSTTMATIQRNG